MATINNSARDALRRATHDPHERLHRHPLLSRLADGTIGHDEYRWLLARWWGFHASVEAALAAAPLPAEFAAAERTKLPALAADLRHYGLTDAQIAALPLCPGLPPLDTAAAAIGCAYVVEGSTLGGRVLAAAVAPLTGPGDDGRRFLLGYGPRHGAMWRQFTTLIEDVAEDARACDAMTCAAQATFVSFETWLRE